MMCKSMMYMKSIHFYGFFTICPCLLTNERIMIILFTFIHTCFPMYHIFKNWSVTQMLLQKRLEYFFSTFYCFHEGEQEVHDINQTIIINQTVYILKYLISKIDRKTLLFYISMPIFRHREINIRVILVIATKLRRNEPDLKQKFNSILPKFQFYTVKRLKTN